MKNSFTWITNGKSTPFYARKSFFLRKEVRAAAALVCGLGQFVFSLNGEKVGDHELDPGWTDYRKWIEYVRFDIKELLQQGQNTVGFEVGNGWYIMGGDHYSFHFPPFMPPNPNPYRPFGPYLVLSFRIEIEYTDGTSEIITPLAENDEAGQETDVRVTDHEVTASNVYGSETIDARRRQSGFSSNNFDDSSWTPAELVPDQDTPKGSMTQQFQPPVKVIRSCSGQYLHTVHRRAVYDFSQNMSFMPELTVAGEAGDIIRIYPAEKLTEDGDVDQMAKGWLPIDNCITLILGEDGTSVFRQKFTYTAGRYLGIEWVSRENARGAEDPLSAPADEKPEKHIIAVQADAITSAWNKSGTWTSDDSRYNAIYSLVEKAVEANMLSVHTDCPTIERFAWQEPNHLMAPAIMFMKDGSRLWKKFFRDMREAQHTCEDRFRDLEGNSFCPGDGLIPSQAPCYIPNALPVPGMGSFYDIIPWGSSIILGVRWHYLFYGDKTVIEENYDAGLRYLEHLKTKITPEGFISHGLGDWGNPDGEMARENIETAFLHADAKTLAEFAGILGRTADQQELLSFAESVRSIYNDRLLVKDKNGRWCYRSWEKRDSGIVMTQAVEAIPLYFEIVPPEKKNDVISAFLDTLEEKQAFASGEVGLPYIIQTASECGMNELIARFITRTSHPSYYAFVLDGETTLGEYWESNPRSHCHDMMGHIIEWYYNGMAGLKILEPGFRKIRISPWLPEGMHELHMTYRSPFGLITIDAENTKGRLVYRYQVPQGITVVE